MSQNATFFYFLISLWKMTNFSGQNVKTNQSESNTPQYCGINQYTCEHLNPTQQIKRNITYAYTASRFNSFISHMHSYTGAACSEMKNTTVYIGLLLPQKEITFSVC